MERWLKKVRAAETASADERMAARVAAVEAEMARVWDELSTRENMLAHIEEWLAYGDAPVEVKGCVLREELHPIMERVYRGRHPEDWGEAPATSEVAEVEPNGEGVYHSVEKVATYTPPAPKAPVGVVKRKSSSKKKGA